MPYLGVRPADITSATEAEIAGDLTVDTNTLKVDAANNRIGVNVASPTKTLDLNAGAVGNIATLTDGVATNFTFKTNSSNVGTFGTEAGSTHLAFMASGAEKGRFLSGGGLTFNGDTAAANALDDYEEGTWTVTNKSVASLSITNTQTAYYVKIGRLVFFNFYITYPSTSDSNNAKISLPFASGVSTSQGHSYVTGRFQSTASNGIVGQIGNGTDEIIFYPNASSTTAFTNANFSGKYLLMSGCYRASA